MFKFFKIKRKDFKMQEIIEKLKDILASEGKKNIKNKDIAKELNIHPDTL